MSYLDIVADNFKFHDKSMRAVGYSLKSISYSAKYKGTDAAKKMNNIGSQISWLRQTLRVGSELAVVKNLLTLIRDRNKMETAEWITEMGEVIAGVYFYTVDHLEWMIKNKIVNFSKPWVDWICNESTMAW